MTSRKDPWPHTFGSHRDAHDSLLQSFRHLKPPFCESSCFRTILTDDRPVLAKMSIKYLPSDPVGELRLRRIMQRNRRPEAVAPSTVRAFPTQEPPFCGNDWAQQTHLLLPTTTTQLKFQSAFRDDINQLMHTFWAWLDDTQDSNQKAKTRSGRRRRDSPYLNAPKAAGGL